jgi:CBS domain-containing protein
LIDLETVRRTPVEGLLEDRRLFMESDRVSEAIGSLRKNEEHEVFVGTGRTLSFATVRDLLRVSNPNTTRLGSAAYPVPQLGREEDLGNAARLMFEHRLRAMPSYIDGNVVKAITARSIVEKIALVGQTRVRASDMMTLDPVTVEADEPATKARETMLHRSFDHLPVTRKGRPLGMLTSSQLLYRLLPEERSPSGFMGPESRTRFDYPVARIFSESFIEVSPETGMHEVVEAVLTKRSSYALVTLGGRIAGIITLRDIVNLLLKREKRESPFYIVGLPVEPIEAERAKTTFKRLAANLSEAMPSIEEARAIIRSKETSGGKTRYEVSINVYSPRHLWAYTESGYDIAEVFEALGPKMKRLLGSKEARATVTRWGRSKKRDVNSRSKRGT